MQSADNVRSVRAADAICVTPDGGHVVWASRDDGRLRVQDIGSGREVLTFGGNEGRLLDAGLTVSLRGLVAVATERGVILHDWREARHVGGSEILCVNAMAFSLDGARLYLGCGSEVRVHVVPSCEVVQTFVLPGNSADDRVTSLALSPSGVTLLVGQTKLQGDRQSGGVHVLDAVTGASRLFFETPEACLFLAALPDYRIVTSFDCRRMSGQGAPVTYWNVSAAAPI